MKYQPYPFKPGLLVWAALGTLSVAACDAGEDPTGGGGTGGAPASTTTTSDATSASTGEFSTTLASASQGTGGGCIGISSKAEPIPLDIFIMLDQSGSMSQDAGNNLSKWQTVKQAISAFVLDPASDGIGVGIQYFGLPISSDPGCFAIPCTSDDDCTGTCTLCHPIAGVCTSPFNGDEDSCEPLDYTWAEAPIATLPAGANPILSSLQMHNPGTNTPTMPAIVGAVTYAKQWQIDHPDHYTVVAFATDGDPAICDIDLDNINQVAADAFAGTPSIRTFVIGVGGSLTALDALAAAGGTTEAFSMDYDPMAQEQFLEAMNTIRNAAVPCIYEIPPPPDGELEDFNKVNVEYLAGGMDPGVQIPKVAGPADCPPSGLGWYYDDEAAPEEIILCPATCDEVQSDLTAELNIVLGCQTIAE
ncbi:MAG: VWA domain-containing protein [Polyangiaceae bacterium]|nr:VWA domain-containing protein [Polyangiaceae bacterium]